MCVGSATTLLAHERCYLFFFLMTTLAGFACQRKTSIIFSLIDSWFVKSLLLLQVQPSCKLPQERHQIALCIEGRQRSSHAVAGETLSASLQCLCLQRMPFKSVACWLLCSSLLISEETPGSSPSCFFWSCSRGHWENSKRAHPWLVG